MGVLGHRYPSLKEIQVSLRERERERERIISQSEREIKEKVKKGTNGFSALFV
jgi:hypothetical protein